MPPGCCFMTSSILRLMSLRLAMETSILAGLRTAVKLNVQDSIIKRSAMPIRRDMTCLELCAGAGGQAIGLERAGFEHTALVEINKHCCETLRLNRPKWNVVPDGDVHKFDGSPFKGVDLVAGGLPCPPFSVAGKQLGKLDERNLFPEAIRVIAE